MVKSIVIKAYVIAFDMNAAGHFLIVTNDPVAVMPIKQPQRQ